MNGDSACVTSVIHILSGSWLTLSLATRCRSRARAGDTEEQWDLSPVHHMGMAGLVLKSPGLQGVQDVAILSSCFRDARLGDTEDREIEIPSFAALARLGEEKRTDTEGPALPLRFCSLPRLAGILNTSSLAGVWDTVGTGKERVFGYSPDSRRRF